MCQLANVANNKAFDGKIANTAEVNEIDKVVEADEAIATNETNKAIAANKQGRQGQ